MKFDLNKLRERITDCEAFTTDERILLLMVLAKVPPEFELEASAPRNYMGRIDAIWAYLSVNDGGEGICAMPVSGVGSAPLPLIAADRTRLEVLRPFARAMAKQFGIVRLAQFSKRKDVETYRP